MPETYPPEQLMGAFDNVSSKQELGEALRDFCGWSGLPWYVLAPMRGSWRFSSEALTNFPADWQRHYNEASLSGMDPVLAEVTRCAGPVDWHEIAQSPALRPAEAAVVALAATHGIRAGVSMALRAPGMRDLIVSFAGPRQQRTRPAVVAVAWLVAARACNCWRRLELSRSIATRPLTQRQRECMVLVAQGKSDWDIGQILGLSDQTVHAHIAAVRARYGSAKRVQLVVRALFEGELSFDDVLS